jgi:hypothetical protein
MKMTGRSRTIVFMGVGALRLSFGVPATGMCKIKAILFASAGKCVHRKIEI